MRGEEKFSSPLTRRFAAPSPFGRGFFSTLLRFRVGIVFKRVFAVYLLVDELIYYALAFAVQVSIAPRFKRKCFDDPVGWTIIRAARRVTYDFVGRSIQNVHLAAVRLR